MEAASILPKPGRPKTGWTVQVQYSLLDRRPEKYMIPYCKEQSIKLLPYGTVAGGFLSERYLGVPVSK